MIKALLVSGDRETVTSVTKVLSELYPKLSLLGAAGSIQEGITRISSEQPDILVLDTKLPDGNGFDLLKHVESSAFKLIFLSNHNEFALKAFKFSAVDFLLKPVDPDELIWAINKACNLISQEEKMDLNILAENIRNLNRKEKIILKTFDHIHLVNQDEIIRVEADKNYSTFFTIDGRKIMVSRSIKEFEDMLNDKGFYRVHKSHIINVTMVRYFEKAEGGYVVMCDGASIPVASRKRELLLELFDTLT
jgi:two-component system LytT family response regulator